MASKMLTTGEVAALAGVDPSTVVAWAEDGRLPCRRTLGGHRRFDPDVVADVLDVPAPDPAATAGG